MHLFALWFALIGLLLTGGGGVTAASETTPARAAEPVVHFWLFYDSYCNVCVRGLNTIVLGILSRYDARQVVVHGRDLAGEAELLRALARRVGREPVDLPAVLIGDHALIGVQEIQERLASLIDKFLAEGGAPLPPIPLLPTPSPVSTGSASQPEAGQRSAAQAETAAVHVVLSWSPGCPACHLVINEVLPPLQQRYGSRLVIRALEVSQPANERLFYAAVQTYELPPNGLACRC